MAHHVDTPDTFRRLYEKMMRKYVFFHFIFLLISLNPIIHSFINFFLSFFVFPRRQQREIRHQLNNKNKMKWSIDASQCYDSYSKNFFLPDITSVSCSQRYPPLPSPLFLLLLLFLLLFSSCYQISRRTRFLFVVISPFWGDN